MNRNDKQTWFMDKNIFRITVIFSLLTILLFPPLIFARVLKVSADGSQEYVDLHLALGEAEPGDEIELLAGRYKGGLVIRQNDISIIGKGAGLTRIEAVNEPVISIENATGVLLEGLSLELQSYTGHSTVYAEKSGIEIRNCVVASNGKAYGIYCVARTEAKIVNNTIVYHQKGGGVNFDGSCFLIIKNNILAFNHFAINNIDETFASPAVSENIFWKNDSNYQGCNPGDGDAVIDPRFISPLKRDFNLKPESPVFSLNSQIIGAKMDLTEPEPEPEPKPEPEPEPEPELDLVVEVLDNKDEGIFSGDEIELKIVLSNSGAGPGKSLEIKSTINLPGIKPFNKKMQEIRPESVMSMNYKFTVPKATLDSILEIKVELSSAENYQVDPVLLSLGVKSIFAKLNIEAEPEGVEVFLNGRRWDNASTVMEKLLPGRYELLFKKADYDDEVRPVILGRREEKFIQIALQKSKGDLLVESFPEGADIRIDGELKGKTPLTVSPLLVGEYNISARKYTPETAYTYQGKVRIKKGNNPFRIIDFKQHNVPVGMVLIPGGEFGMGSGQGEKDEQPVHKVYVDPFYIDLYEVSAGEFKKYLQETGQSVREFISENKLVKDDLPMTGISWNDAIKYARWIKKRLPTEAEWELAAKGMSGRKWPWGNGFSVQMANTVGKSDGYPELAPVSAFPGGKSEYGIFNMAGNVWEWCWDIYSSSYYENSPYANPQGPEQGDAYRVLRGGGWSYGRFDARSSNRFRLEPDLRRNYVGIRLVFVPEIEIP